MPQTHLREGLALTLAEPGVSTIGFMSLFCLVPVRQDQTCAR